MKIVCYGYRDWALNIYRNLKKLTSCEIIIKGHVDIDISYLDNIRPDYVLFYGWSWKIPATVVSRYKCLMLHPSDLPKFRGGSPIQNQILNGLIDTKLSIFQITDKIDAGPILSKRPLSLRGNMSEILSRIEDIGTEVTVAILSGDFKLLPQNENDASYFKRRLPEESEITFEEISNASALEIYNKVRCLQDPYPNAFIRMSDGSKLYIKSVETDDACSD